MGATCGRDGCSHFGNNFSSSFAATVSSTLKARLIEAKDADAEAKAVAPGATVDRRQSFFRRLSGRDFPSFTAHSP